MVISVFVSFVAGMSKKLLICLLLHKLFHIEIFSCFIGYYSFCKYFTFNYSITLMCFYIVILKIYISFFFL